jgi:Protein of unknown function (DUF2924)
MAPDVTAEVRALERLDLHGLREAWLVRYGPAPKLRSPELLRLALAWRIQMDCEGGLDAATRRRLASGAAVGRTDHVGRGVRIKREWRGRTYEVERTEGGYRWEDQLYASLSSVAQAITGVKRNGPKFFGLREEGAA